MCVYVFFYMWYNKIGSNDSQNKKRKREKSMKVTKEQTYYLKRDDDELVAYVSLRKEIVQCAIYAEATTLEMLTDVLDFFAHYTPYNREYIEEKFHVAYSKTNRTECEGNFRISVSQ